MATQKMLSPASECSSPRYSTARCSGSTTNPFRYGGLTGYERDTADRQYVRARHYALGVGRWLSRDPDGFDGDDANLCRYVENDPIIFIHPRTELIRQPVGQLAQRLYTPEMPATLQKGYYVKSL